MDLLHSGKSLTRPWAACAQRLPIALRRLHRYHLGQIMLALAMITALVQPEMVAAQDAPGETGAAAGMVAVTAVDSSRFPEVDIYIHATDSAGLPIANLTAADVALQEEGSATPAGDLVVAPDVSQPLQLIVVADRSTDQASWSAIQVAINTLLDQLQPDDQAALVVYAADVQVVQELTADLDGLRALLAATPTGGGSSATNSALALGLQLAQSAPAGRRVLLLVADRPDNQPAGAVAVPTAQELAAQAQSNGVMVNVFGHGPNVVAAPAFVDLTAPGGRLVTVATAADLVSQLQVFPNLLRQGYRISFRSQQLADDADHTARLVIASGGAAAAGSELSTALTFRAPRGVVAVKLTTLQDGQRVSGNLSIGVEVTAPAPIASLAFVLDETQVITEVRQMVGGIVWPSTQTTPGRHTLSVEATDAAGNRGRTAVSVEVVPPLTLQVESAGGEVQIGAPVVITAHVASFYPDATLEVFLGKTLAAMISQPTETTRVELETKDLEPGRYAVMVRLSNSLGNQLTNGDTVVTLTPAAPAAAVKAPWWTPIVAWAQALWRWLLLLVALILLLPFFWWLLRRRRTRSAGGVSGDTAQERASAALLRKAPSCRVQLLNAGNVATRFQLRAEDPDDTLTVAFAVGGVLLLPSSSGQASRAAAVALARPTVQPAPAPLAPVAQAANGSQPSAVSSTVDTARGAVTTVTEGVGKVTGASALLSDLLTTLGSLLPAGLAKPLQQAASTLRKGQASVQRVQTRTQMAQASASRVGKLSGQLVSTAKPVNKALQLTPAPAARSQADFGLVAAPAAGSSSPASVMSATGQAAASTPASKWVETAVVAPGETLLVDLFVTPRRKPGRNRPVEFQLQSRAAGQADAPVVIDDVSLNLR